MDEFHRLNFFLFTGGPGAGKTTVLEALKEHGYQVVPEVARAIIKNQHAVGGNAIHTGDRNAYCDLMIQQSIGDYLNYLDLRQPVFFDRGIPDLYSYTKRFCGGLRLDVEQAVKQYRYNTKVFLFPPWLEIYCHDSERKQEYHEAIETWHAVKEGYGACGYQMIEMPKISVLERMEFILRSINTL